MKLVNMNCPNCSGELEINEEKRIAVCKYCGTRWYIEDEGLSKLSRLERRVDDLEKKQAESLKSQATAQTPRRPEPSVSRPSQPVIPGKQTEKNPGDGV